VRKSVMRNPASAENRLPTRFDVETEEGATSTGG